MKYKIKAKQQIKTNKMQVKKAVKGEKIKTLPWNLAQVGSLRVDQRPSETALDVVR